MQGLVKLADFGVAAKLGELEEHRDELQQHVVGTPYWMAPEVWGAVCVCGGGRRRAGKGFLQGTGVY